MKRTIALIVLGLAWAAAFATAQQRVPALVNYQGKLLDQSGNTVPNGNYELQFRLWSAASAGSLIWGRTYQVNVQDGLFNVVLGDGGGALPGAQTDDITAAFGAPERFLGLTIAKDHTGATLANPQEIQPRQQLLSAPYALQANDAAKLGGTVATNYMKIGGGLRAAGVPAFSNGEMVNSALTASGANRIGINNANPQRELDVGGSALVSGNLRVSGTLGVGADASTPHQLYVSGNAKVTQNLGIGRDPASNQRLHVAGPTTLDENLTVGSFLSVNGTVTTAADDIGGFHFPSNPYGGAGDYANLKLNRQGTSGENQVLSLNVGNDPGELLQLNSSGNIELKANATTNGTVSIYGTVKAFQPVQTRTVDVVHTAETDGFLMLSGYKINLYYEIFDAAGAILWGNWLNNQSDSPGNVSVVTLPIAKGEKYKVRKDSTGLTGHNEWVKWRPIGLP
jgi:hypothetical protein